MKIFLEDKVVTIFRDKNKNDKFIISDTDKQLELDYYLEEHKSLAGQFTIKNQCWGQVREIAELYLYPMQIKDYKWEDDDYSIDSDYILASGADIRKLKFPKDAVF